MSDGRSNTGLRLMAIAAVMGGSLIGGMGLSALSRHLTAGDVAMMEAPASAIEEEASEPMAREVDAAPRQTETFRSERDQAPAQQELARRREADRGLANQPAPSPPPRPGTSSGQPDHRLNPSYGSVSLSSGFAPDPYTVQVQAGGDVDASALSGACRGFIARAPDVRVSYSAGSFPLIIAVSSRLDATLVVNAPDGSWHCDDNSGGNNNPRIRFAAPQSGQYDVWVGLRTQGALAPSQLRISEVE